MTKLANCLLRQAKDFKNFDESEVVEASKIYQSRGKAEDEANIQAIEDHLDDLRTQRKAIVDHVLEQFKSKEPAKYAKIAAANQPATVPIVTQQSDNPSPEVAPLTDKERGIAMVAEGIDELISLLGGKTNMLPEEEARLIPIMSKIFRGAAIAGYATFKDSARWVYQQIHAKSPEVAAKLSIENLQAGYINIAKDIGGDKRAALDFDSIEQLMADDTKASPAIDAAAHEAATSHLNDKPQPTPGQKAANNYAVGSIPASATAIGMPISIENPQGSIRWKLDTDRLKAIAVTIIDNRHNSAEARKPALAMLDALAEITGADVTKVEGGFDRLQTAIDGLIRNFPVQQETAQEIFEAGWKNKMQQHYGYIKGTTGRDKDHIDIFLAPGADTASKVWVIDQKNQDGSFDEHKVVLGPETEAEARAAYLANYQPGWDGIGAITSMPVPAFKAWAGDGKVKRNPLAYVEAQTPEKTTSAPEVAAEPEAKVGAGETTTTQHENATAPEHVKDETGVTVAELKQIAKAFRDAIDRGDDAEVTNIFDAPTKSEIVRLKTKADAEVAKSGWLTPAQAKERVQEWRDRAAAQYDNDETRSANSQKIVISLFDLTGKWSQPWEDAGYQVYRFDIQNGDQAEHNGEVINLGDINNFSTDFFNDIFGSFDGLDVHAILAACPCTDFAVSGARHFAVKDADGRTVSSIKLVNTTLATIEYFKPSIWALENPVGRIEELTGLPPWRLSFDPYHLGDSYTKKTLIWGRFNADLPVAPVEPTEGSKMHIQYGGKSQATKNARSATPEGFAYGFFMANNAADNPVLAIAGKYDRLDRGAIKAAIDAGVTAEQIDEAVEDFYYMDLDDDAANEAIRDLAGQPDPKSGLPAVREQLFVEFDGQRYQVDSMQDASEKWEAFRDETGVGSSEVSNLPIFDQTGKQVAYVSYNGKVWRGDDYVPNAEPVYVPIGQRDNSEKQPAAPVAESLAPVPSEPGNAGVASSQGGAAADAHWLHDEIVNLIHFKGRTQNRRALDKIVELLKRRAAGEDIRNGKVKSHVSGFKNEAALSEVLNRIVTRLETEDKETTAAKRKETAQAKKETADGDKTDQAQQSKPQAQEQDAPAGPKLEKLLKGTETAGTPSVKAVADDAELAKLILATAEKGSRMYGVEVANRLYGPNAEAARQTILEALTGAKVPKSRAGHKATMQALYDRFGVQPDAIATMQRELDKKLNAAAGVGPAAAEPAAAGADEAAEPTVDDKGNPIRKVGDRVEITGGQFSGRHGEVTDVTKSRMVAIGLARGVKSEWTTYHYNVRSDNGTELYAGPDQMKTEESRPESVVMDPVVNGRAMEPESLHRSIGYDKQSAQNFRAKAHRARKSSAIAEHKRAAERSDASAVEKQAVWDEWAAKNPAEAEKIAPKPAAKTAATPQDAAAAAAPVDTAGAIKAAGLVVTKTTTKNNKPVWEVSGNTREHSGMLKAMGGRWYGPKKVWSFYNDDPSIAIAGKLGGSTAAPAPQIALFPNEVMLPENPYVYRKESSGGWTWRSGNGNPSPLGAATLIIPQLEAVLAAKNPTIIGKSVADMNDNALENIADTETPAGEKARAELEARDAADEPDIGAMFDNAVDELFGDAPIVATPDPWKTVLIPHGTTVRLEGADYTVRNDYTEGHRNDGEPVSLRTSGQVARVVDKPYEAVGYALRAGELMAEAKAKIKNPTTPEGYAAALANPDILDEYQDEFDAYFQERLLAVRKEMQNLGWIKDDAKLVKNGREARFSFRQIGPGRNIVGMTINDVEDKLTLTPEKFALLADQTAGLTQARQDLDEMQAQHQKQGNFADDRLNGRIERQKKLIEEYKVAIHDLGMEDLAARMAEDDKAAEAPIEKATDPITELQEHINALYVGKAGTGKFNDGIRATAGKMYRAIVERNAVALGDILNMSNLTSRAVFSELTKSKLPATVSGTHDAINAFFAKINDGIAKAETKKPERWESYVVTDAPQPGRFVVSERREDGSYQHFATFALSANGVPQRVEHYYESESTREPARKAMEKWAKERKAAEPKKPVTPQVAAPAGSTPLGAAPTRTAGEAGASAAKNAAMGINEVRKGLLALFKAKPGTLGMAVFGAPFDEETYAAAKPMFAAGIAHFKQAGADLMQMVAALVKDLQDSGLTRAETLGMRPYVIRFMEDVKSGKVVYDENEEVANNGSERDTDTNAGEGNQGSGDWILGTAGQADQAGMGDQPAANVVAPGDAGVSERPGAGTSDGNVGSVGSVSEGGNAANGRPGTGGNGVVDAGAGGRKPGKRPVGSSDGSDQQGQRPTEGSRAEVANYHIADPEQLIGGTPKVRFARNRKAIEALQAITAEGRPPQQDELDAMAGYIGWGSFGQDLFQGTFDRPKPKAGWEKESDWLREHLGKEAWESAQASIINAHYTDPITVSTMWSMVRQMGFTGGRVLEPSMGVGNFFGLMPRDLMARSILAGIEMDTTTGGMAKLLYPDANIQIKPYQDSKTADGFYDLVIGNWPFAKDGPADRRYLKLSPSLHDFFFLKALDQTRPGGLVVGITSAGTMDKQGSLTRAALAEKADLVAAFRLPTGAFEKYAGTSVVTDIIILKKRETQNADVRNSGWLTTIEVDTPSGNKVKVNQYFARKPGNVLGTLNFGHGTTYGRPAMIVDRPVNLEARMDELAATLPEGVFEPATTKAKTIQYVTNNTKDRQQSIITQGGKLFQVQGEYLAPLHEVYDYRVKDSKKTADREAQLVKLIDLRRKHGALIDADRDGLEDAETRRKALNDAYKAFTKAHGSLGDSEGMAIMRRLGDPFFAPLAALEVGGKPAAILSSATMRTKKKLENPSVRDALIMMRNESVFVDIGRIADLSGVSVDVAAKELTESGAIFLTPDGTFDVSDVYLSGNVRRKLREAEAAAEAGMNMERNIEALRRVVPADIPYFNIEAKLGATWIPVEHYKQFIEHMLGTNSDGIEARFVINRWKVRFTDRQLNNRPEAKTTWGAEGIHFDKLIMHAMGNMAIKIWGKDADGNKVINEDLSEKANEKANKIREEFGTWLWSDPARKIEMERAYNESMNAIAIPSFDGSFMGFEGMALRRGNSPFDMRSHQGNAVYRGLVNRRGIYAHEVGTGKTYTMGALAVESRRYGIAKKPLIFAHNANSSSVAREIGEQYPGAKLLYIDNLAPDRIDVTLRQIANDEWDAIVVPHSLINRFSLKEETLMEISRHQIEALEQEAIEAANDDGIGLTVEMMNDEDAMKKVRSVTAKQLVHGRNQIIKMIKEMALKSSKEGAVSFEDMGIDMVIVDEAHEFKKPPLATRMSMKGLNKTASAQSISLMLLTDYVKKLNGGTGVHVFTGTPITNTMNEIYNMMRFVMDDQMSRDGIREWDAWFNTFADQTSDVELTPAGEYEPVSRLAAFVNVPELRRMAGQYMDIVFADDMPEFKPRVTKSGKTLTSENLTDAERDELLNGRTENPIGRPYKKVINDVGEMSPEQVAIFDELKQRAASFKAASKKERKEIMLSGDNRNPVIVETAAANAGLDARLYDIEASDSPENKVNRVAKNVVAHYKEHDQATQVIFVDKGYTSESVSRKKDRATGQVTVVKKPRFNLVRDIVAKLTEQGIPLNQIAIVDGGVSKEKRKEIADAMNLSKIRVVIGLTDTLGVGVNMQANLRAMHHLDAPWMPGELEQRNGRGHRQGNAWNTVLEYRYITERIDGRRWQVLSIKDRFIKQFLKADDSIRVIEGDAVSLDEDGDLGNTLSDAAGDPRLLMINKLRSDVQKLENRERMHAQGIFDARRAIVSLGEKIKRVGKALEAYRKDFEKFKAVAKDDLVIEVAGRRFTDVEKANEVMELVASKVAVNADPIEIAKLWGFLITAAQPVSWRGIEYQINGAAMHQMGKPTIESARATMYGIAKRVEGMEADIAEWEGSIPRMEESAKAPFSRSKDLEKKRKMLADTESDIQRNPVPAPSWLRNGAPSGTEAFVDGKPLVIEGHRYTNEGYFVTVSDGDMTRDVPYMEVMDENGLPKYEEHTFVAPKIIKAEDKGVKDGLGRTQTPLEPGWYRVTDDKGVKEATDRNLTADQIKELVGHGYKLQRARTIDVSKYHFRSFSRYGTPTIEVVENVSTVEIEGLPDHKFYAFKDGKEWRVIEDSTGVSLGRADTKKGAIDAANGAVQNNGADKVLARIAELKLTEQQMRDAVNAFKDKESKAGGDASFNRSASATSGTIDEQLLGATIDRVVAASPSQWGRDTVVAVPLFADLPAPILAKAKKEGYDGNGRKDTGEKLTGVTYDGKVYLVQENISGELEAEETLLHERIHQILHGNANDESGKALRQILGRLYARIGGKAEIEAMAKDAGFDISGPIAALQSVAPANRPAFLAEEFLAHAEGARAYEATGAQIMRAIKEFWGEFRNWLRSSGFVRIAEAVGVRLSDFTGSDLAWTLKGIRQQAAGTGDKAIRFMTAYHGTPHEVDRFSVSKIGTGEGAQSFGWGLYFSSAKEVAQHYKDVGQSNRETSHASAARQYYDYKHRFGGDMAEGRDLWIMSQPDMDLARKIWRDVARSPEKYRGGRVYQVDLAPEPDQYLLWDKPLSEQPENVKNALAAIGQDRNLEGSQIYHKIGIEKGTDEAASKYLNSLGIAGIKYLDGGSRYSTSEDWTVKSPEGMVHRFSSQRAADNYVKGREGYEITKPAAEYNFVIFDENDVTITGMESRGPIDFTGYSADEIRDGLVESFGGRAIRQLEANGLLNVMENAEAFKALFPNVDVSPSAKALFFRDRAYLFANRMHPATSRIELLHEIGEHWGLERMLGKKGYRNLIDHIKALRTEDSADGRYVAARWNFVVSEYITKENDPRKKLIEGGDRFMHEVLAQIGQNADIQTRGWWKQMLEMVKRFLVEMGFTGKIKVADIQDMVFYSLKVAARYDLSKHIDKVNYRPAGEGRYHVVAAKSETAVWSNKKATLSDIENALGKEIARKIEVGEGGPVPGLSDAKSLSGLDLKVGGDGMRGFYDQIVPDTLRKVLKQVGAGETAVEQINIGGSGNWTVEYEDGSKLPDHMSRSDAEEIANDRGGKIVPVGDMMQPGIVLSDKLKESALSGLPLFSKAPSGALVLNGTDLRGEELTLADIKEWGTQGNIRQVAVDIVSPEGTYVGAASIGLENGKPTAIYHVEIKPEHRGGSWGEKFVRAMVNSAESDIYVDNTVPDAVGFWEKMGLQWFEGGKNHGNGTITQENYASARPARTDSTETGAGRRGGQAEAPAAGEVPLESRGNYLDELQTTETYRRLKSAVSSGPTEHTFNKWWHTTVGTMSHLASINKPFARVFNSVQDFLDDSAAFSKRAEEKAPGLIPTGFFAKPLDPEDSAAISDPIFKATLHKHVLTDDEMRAGRFLISDPEEISMPQEWVEFGALNDTQIDYVHQFHAAINHSLEDATRADLLRMARRALPKEMADIAFAETQTAAEFVARVEEAAADRATITGEDNLLDEWRDSSNALMARLEKLRSEGYAPLMRFGEYTLYFYQTDEDGAKKPIYFTMFDSESERNAAEADLLAHVEEEFGEVEVERNIRKEMASPMFEGMTPEMVESFAKALGVEQDAVYQEFLKKATNNRSTLRRLIHRKGTAGYSNDVTRVLASFVVSNARRSSAAIHMTEARENLEEIERGDVFNVAKDLVNYVQNPTEEAGALRGFMFFNFLGGSLASAMVNYTQVALQVTPYLYQFAKTDAVKEVAKALKLATQIIYADVRHQPMPGMGRELTAALKQAEQEGITQPNEIHQLMAEARGGTWSRAGGRKAAKLLGKNEAVWGAKAEWTMQRLMRGWGSFFGIAEQSNRLTAFIAAHNIATQQGMGEQTAYEFAKKAVTETASIYNKGNRPTWARGPIGATIFTFKQFSIQYLEFMRRLYKNDKEAFAVGVGMLILMAGATGLPGSDDLDDILDTIGQWMGYPANTKRWRRKHVELVFGKAGADFVLNGVSAILPIDVHARLGLGNIIPGTGMLNPARQDKEREVLEVIGPFGGLVLNYLNASKLAVQGKTYKAVETAAPSAIANLSKGVRMAVTGHAEDRQGKRIADASKFEAFMKGIGIQPDAVSDVYKLRGEMETDKAIMRNMKSALSDQWADGIAHQDAEATQDALKKLREWNALYPDYRITIRPGDVFRKARELKTSAKERYLKYSPKDLRERFTEDLATE